MGITVGLLAEYSRIFSNHKDSIEKLSTGIPKSIFLKAGTSFLNKQLIDQTSINFLDVINWWFNSENNQFKNDLKERAYQSYSKNEIFELAMLSPISSLKLLQIGFSKIDEIYEKDKNTIESDLFKIYLLLNESFTCLHTISGEYIEKNYPDIAVGMLLLNIGFSTNDLTNFIYSREFFCQSVKSFFLLDFIKKEKNLVPHINIFLKNFNIISMTEYITRIYGILKPLGEKMQKGINGFIEYSVENISDNEFILKFSVQDYSKVDDLDFRVVRANPFVKFEKEVYRITHPIFIIDKLFKGLYFYLSKINEDINKDVKINSFRSFYTSNFSEKYLFYEVMKYSFNEKYIKFTGAAIDIMGIQGAPDYYIRNGKHIYLFENKDVLIKAEVKEKPFFENLEKELKIKFLEDKKGKGVGIKQIIKNIERILATTNPFDKNYKAHKVIVHPILIIHDIMYDTPGLNHLLNNWFNKELELLKERGFFIENIRPLIVMNIDSLIRVSELLRIGKIDLGELLGVYYKNLNTRKKNFRDEQAMKDSVSNIYLPSTKVIENWLNAKHFNVEKDNKILKYAYEKAKE